MARLKALHKSDSPGVCRYCGGPQPEGFDHCRSPEGCIRFLVKKIERLEKALKTQGGSLTLLRKSVGTTTEFMQATEECLETHDGRIKLALERLGIEVEDE